MSIRPALGVLASRVRQEEKAILDALKARGVGAELIDPRQLVISAAAPWRGPQVILNREVGHHRALYAAAALSACGAVMLNSYAATRTCGDKWLTTTALVAAGLPTPATSLALTPQAGVFAIADVGYPAVVKPLVGSWGRLVTKVSTIETAEAVMEHIEALPNPASHMVYVQKAVPNTGHDIRILVVGGRVIAGSRRVSETFRANVARGAVSAALEITPELCDLAIRAADAVGADIAGVDLIQDQTGKVWVIEVNDRVEFKGLQQAHLGRVDVAGAITDLLLKTSEEAV